MSERCIIHLMDAEDLERSANSPALAGLVADGWSVMANMMVETGSGTRIALLMAPPKKKIGGGLSASQIVIPIVFTILIHGATLAWLLT